MRKLLGVVKVLVLMVVVMVLSGCAGTIKLTETANFKNAQNPDVVFIIEDKHFSDWVVVGATIEVSSLNEISKAIDTVFKDKAVAIYPHGKPVPEFLNRGVDIVKITPVEFDLWRPVGPFFRGKFTADVSINGKTKRIEAKGRKGITSPFSTGKSETIGASDRTFLDFAQKIREELKIQ